MHTRFRAALLAALALRGGSASAQTPEGTVPAAPSEAPPPAESGTTLGELTPEGTYTVKTGDTLWDLSQRFLNNPWYWPKIWADNPGVENPHWIYPGNNLKIRVGGEGLAGEVSPVAGAAPEESWDEGEPLPRTTKPEVADFTVGTMNGADSMGQEADLVTIAGRKGIGLAPGGTLRARVESIVTTGELQQSGRIESSFEQKGLLSTYDRVYVSFKDLDKVRIGEEYSIFKTADRDVDGAPDEIVHPVTKQSYGYQMLLLGSLKIIAKEAKMAVAEISATFETIERGDRVGPAVALDRKVRATPNSKNVDGVILSTHIAKQFTIAEQAVVFIDRGSKQGVSEGNTFTVVQQGDGLEMLQMNPESVDLVEHKEGPAEPVASLVVFDVQPETSAALVVKSVREVMVGDKVVMRAQGGAGGDGAR